MIKAIIFDFDGVIVESTDIKTAGFLELFRNYPQKIDEITKYHIENGGISRYTKFRYIYENILGQKLSDEKMNELGKQFSRIVVQKVLKAPFVPGAKKFLDRNKNRYQFFIASGTPEEELGKIVSKRGIRQYFREIHGSPKTKRDIITDIMKRYKFRRDEVVYIGDAESDRLAAKEACVSFIERKAKEPFTSLVSTNKVLLKECG